mmetsp:Transcript_18266/g.21939  ORF Transcript_18266/g.21939 Transcript_18266/m.21939 type:complete len:152 (+) Transcript_18266:115-570(+)
MISRVFVLLFSLACTANAFTSSGFTGSRTFAAPRSANTLSMAVAEIGSISEFQEVINGSGSSLVVVDYSTTWCGPCKVIAPKFDDFSEKYTDAIFLKVIGDSSAEASKLMKQEGVRSVPSFHYFINGEKKDVINGANAEAIEAAITKHLPQ